MPGRDRVPRAGNERGFAFTNLAKSDAVFHGDWITGSSPAMTFLFFEAAHPSAVALCRPLAGGRSGGLRIDQCKE